MKKKIIHLSSFESLGVLHTAFKSLFTLLNRNFDEIVIVNIDNLKMFKKKEFNYYDTKIKKKFPKKVRFFNPKNFRELQSKLDFKNSVLINNINTTFEEYRILRFLKKINVPQIVIANIGNIQGSVFYYMKKNYRYYLQIFSIHFPKKLAAILSSIGFFSKIDIRFTSNKKLLGNFEKNKKKFLKRPSIYKEMILVKSKAFDNLKEKKTSQEYITLLDFEPDYREMVESTGKFSQTDIDKHYINSINFLKKIKKIFNKKIVICIHPKYDLKKISKIYHEFDVKQFRTRYFIERSFIVLFYDSSAIVDAIVNKKKIISLKSDLYKGKKNMADTIRDIIPFKSMNISNTKGLPKRDIIIKQLNNKINLYDNYLNDFGAKNLDEIGTQKIIDIIKLRYFKKKDNNSLSKK